MRGILPSRFLPGMEWKDTPASRWQSWLDTTKQHDAAIHWLRDMVNRLMQRRGGAETVAAATGTMFFRIVLGAITRLHDHPDTILANPRDGAGWSEELVTIAKLHDLRATPFDGQEIEKRWIEPEGLAGVMRTRTFTYEYDFSYMVRQETREDGSLEVQSVTPGWYHHEVVECRRGPTMLEGVDWTDTTSRHWGKELGAA